MLDLSCNDLTRIENLKSVPVRPRATINARGETLLLELARIETLRQSDRPHRKSRMVIIEAWKRDARLHPQCVSSLSQLQILQLQYNEIQTIGERRGSSFLIDGFFAQVRVWETSRVCKCFVSIAIRCLRFGQMNWAN